MSCRQIFEFTQYGVQEVSAKKATIQVCNQTAPRLTRWLIVCVGGKKMHL